MGWFPEQKLDGVSGIRELDCVALPTAHRCMQKLKERDIPGRAESQYPPVSVGAGGGPCQTGPMHPWEHKIIESESRVGNMWVRSCGTIAPVGSYLRIGVGGRLAWTGL